MRCPVAVLGGSGIYPDPGNKSKTLALTKMKELPEDAPKYARTFFDGIFGKYAPNIGDEVLVSKLKYKMAATFTTVKRKLRTVIRIRFTRRHPDAPERQR